MEQSKYTIDVTVWYDIHTKSTVSCHTLRFIQSSSEPGICPRTQYKASRQSKQMEQAKGNILMEYSKHVYYDPEPHLIPLMTSQSIPCSILFLLCTIHSSQPLSPPHFCGYCQSVSSVLWRKMRSRFYTQPCGGWSLSPPPRPPKKTVHPRNHCTSYLYPNPNSHPFQPTERWDISFPSHSQFRLFWNSLMVG